MSGAVKGAGLRFKGRKKVAVDLLGRCSWSLLIVRVSGEGRVAQGGRTRRVKGGKDGMRADVSGCRATSQCTRVHEVNVAFSSWLLLMASVVGGIIVLPPYSRSSVGIGSRGVSPASAVLPGAGTGYLWVKQSLR